MKIRLLLFVALLFSVVSWGQVTIVSDGLNNASTLFTLTSGAYYTGNSVAGDRPATSAFAIEGTHSYGMSSGTGTLLSNADINTSAYTSVFMTIRLASFSIGSTGNGADGGDIVTVEVSPDGGTTWYSTVRVLGNANAYWSYSGGTGNASTAYDGNAAPVDFTPAGGASRTTDGYSTITVTGLPSISNLRFRIKLLNDNANERWLVDDFKVQGTPAGGAPVISSALTGSVVHGSAYSYTIVASNTPTSYNATSLPAGLSVNTSTGAITGTPTAGVAGSPYNISISATNGTGTDTKTLVLTITPKALTISGLTADNKVYDRLTTATLSGTGSLVGIVGADVVTLSGTPAPTFATAAVGTAKAVTVTGYTLSGAQAANYTVTQPTGLTANITAKPLTVTGAFANNKVYDGTTTATISGGSLVGLINPDTATLNPSGTFATANVGTGIAVTATSTISGGQSANYSLTVPTGLSADITQASQTITFNALAAQVVGGANFNLTATSTSGLTITYTSSNPAVATVSGNTVTIVGVGTTVITASQAGNANYAAAANVTQNQVVNSAACHSEDFSGLGTIAAYNSGSWAGTGGTWSATDARGDQTINGKAITIRTGVLTSPTFTDGIAAITMTTKLNFADAGGNLTVKVNGTSIGTIPYSTSAVTTTITGINVDGNVVITVENANSQRVSIDDLNWTCYTACVSGSNPAGTISGTTPACGSTSLSFSAPAANLYWQTSATGTSFTYPSTSSYTANATGTYYIRLYDGTCWSAGTVSYAVTVNTAPAVTVQPVNKSILIGASTFFAVTATGTGLTYQWQVDTGGGFVNLTNTGVYSTVTTATMNITAATGAMSGYLYRCIVTGTAPCTTATSSSASLTVTNASPNNATTVTTCYGNNNITLSWTAATGSPDGYVVFALQSATAPASASPNDAGTYTANSDFSLATTVAPASLGKCVYKGAATTAAITGLTNGVNYSFTVVAYKGAAQTGWATGINATGSWRITNTPIDMPEVSALAATVANAQSVVTWTNPTPLACYDEYLVVANQGAVSFTPTGNGSAYTANAVYSGANQVVYKGTGTTQTVTGLTNGLSYCYKVFVRRGTEWSDGVSVCQTPNINYCASAGNTSYATSLTNVTLNTINNNSAKPSGYSDYTGLSTNLQRNEDYTLSTKVNTDGNYTVMSFAWIDFNHDGDFVDAGEAFGLGSATNTANGLTTLSPLTITIPLTAALGATRMRVIATFDGDSSPCLSGFDGEVEDYTINIIAECVPTQSVTTIAPTSGPTATEVTITGTGFTAGTTVTFNGIAATVIFVNSTTLTVTVPSGITTGNIVVKESGCRLTAGTFTQIKQSGTCPSPNSLTDLIISEVYDSVANNSWYMELYNPTNAAIDLNAAGANYKIVRYGDIGTTIGIRTVDISGVIAPGGVYLADLGSDSFCGALPFNYIAKANGINENDEIRLTKNDITVDIVHCPNEKGYTIIRNLAAVGPSATYNAADWNLNTTETCANLGIVSFVFANTTPSVNTNPADVSVCGTTASFAVTATANNSGALTYQWFYNNGVTAGWTSLTTLAGLTVTGATTNSLTLTGGIASYNGYQFYCQVTESGTCSMASDAAQLRVYSTTWNGTTWSNGIPTLGMLTTINGNYNTTTNGDIDACSLIVKTGFTATVTSNHYINIQNDLTVEAGGTLDVLNNGSLVQVSDTGVNTGTILMKRTANIRLYDYVYWSAPVANFPVASVSPSSPTGVIFKWNPTVANTNGGFGNWENTIENMVTAKGYIVRGPTGFNNTAPQAMTANFSGVPHNGIYTPSIVRGNNTAADYPGTNGITITNKEDNWNLIGNPYPSAIKSLDFLAANTNIEGAVRLWTHGTLPNAGTPNPFYGSFAYNYTATDYIVHNGTATTSGPVGFNGLIAAGQSFLVLMNDGVAATQTVTFNNALRSKTYDNSQFYKNANSQKTPGGIDRHRIWLDLISPTNVINRAVVGYVDGATDQKDRLYDAYTDYKNAQNFYSIINEEVVVIQGKSLPFKIEDRVPMGIKIPSSGTYQIAIAAVDGLFSSGQTIYLEDLLLNVIHNLSVAPYQFTTVPGIINNRFVLRYTDAALGNDTFEIIGNGVTVATQNHDIHIKSQLEPMKNITVYDVLGRLVFEKNNVNNTQFTIQNLVVNQQALIVKIILENGQTVSKKIVF